MNRRDALERLAVAGSVALAGCASSRFGSGTVLGRVDVINASFVPNRIRLMIERGDETLFEVHWSDHVDGIVKALIDTRANILEATGEAEVWDFRLRFEAHEQLSELNVALTESGIPVTLRHIYNPTLPKEATTLSEEQREALRVAYQRGFFEVPRGITLAELADELDISDSALSQRMRRGLSVAVKQVVFPQTDKLSSGQ